jgi:hypothetical protein
MRRRIEIVAFETERIIQRSLATQCPICETQTELLTLSQAAELVQVESEVIRGWLLGGQTHSATTPDGEHRICRNSILKFSPRAIGD